MILQRWFSVFSWLTCILFTPLVFAQQNTPQTQAHQNPPAEKTEELGPPVAEGTSIWRFDCSVIDPDEVKFSTELKRPPSLNAKDENCYNAVPVPDGVTELPPYHAWVGKDKKHCVIPITKDPAKHLEAGDVLVYFRNVHGGSTSLYEHVAKGRWHAAIVNDKNGQLMHVDSPSSMSGSNFNSGVYHIIRLRKYPPEVKDQKTLKQWQADPEKKKILDDYTQQRKQKLEQVQKALVAVKAAGFGYDTDRKTEVTIPKEREKLQKQFQEKGSCSPMSLYCSELAITPFVMAGLKPPKAQSLSQSLERMEKEIIPKLIKNENSQKTKEKVIDEALDHLFSDSAMLREMGVGGNEITAMQTRGVIPGPVAEAKALYKKLFMAGPLERPLILMAYQATAGKDKGQIIGPSDLFDAIYDTDGDFSYVGTHLGDVFCSGGGSATLAGSRVGGGAGGGGGPDTVAPTN